MFLFFSSDAQWISMRKKRIGTLFVLVELQGTLTAKKLKQTIGGIHWLHGMISGIHLHSWYGSKTLRLSLLSPEKMNRAKQLLAAPQQKTEQNQTTICSLPEKMNRTKQLFAAPQQKNKQSQTTICSPPAKTEQNQTTICSRPAKD